ncbi:Uncharacterized protein FWK35_00030388 [Aphis craccivora]|uniref:Uncharacterized protein n=1 Tax=Aphis craccivora TaxID=307492 RepID=A0A6G0VX27_APHCR|nr:Uncharacterized protein FWK35_00030388 [Aphis craccivora]
MLIVQRRVQRVGLNTLKNRLMRTEIPTPFSKIPAKSQGNPLVNSKNIDISNQSSENSSSTQIVLSESISTSTEICEEITGSQTPGYLSPKKPRKVEKKKTACVLLLNTI